MASKVITENDLTNILNEVLPAERAAGVILFNDDNHTMAGAITLLDSAANYDRFLICYKTNDNEYGSVEVCNPNGKTVNLCVDRISVDANHTHWLKSKTVQISGTSINTLGSGYYATGQISLMGGGNAIYYDDYITITQVIGFKHLVSEQQVIVDTTATILASGIMLYRIGNIRILHINEATGFSKTGLIPSADRPSAGLYGSGIRTTNGNLGTSFGRIYVNTNGDIMAYYAGSFNSSGAGFSAVASTDVITGTVIWSVT